MKYVLFFFISGIMVSCTSTDRKSDVERATQDSLSNLAMKDTANYTTIQWTDSTFQDLGKVNEGEVVEVTWHFKNTGTKPLVINRVSPSCGCTVADRPEEPIAPNKEGSIKAKFDSKGQHAGENRKNLTVIANTKFDAVHNLSFRVEVVKK